MNPWLYLCYVKDNFSKQADLYASYRPAYPAALFDFIFQHVTNKKAAWDCATGNGQTAKELCRHFTQVFATDISQKQLNNAHQAENISYSIQPAEQTNFPDHTFDLITVSQALHWFDFDKFYKEVRRVGKPGSWLSVWMYSLLRITPEIDKIIENYHFDTLSSYWDKERKYVDNNYTTIGFPFDEIKTPAFSIGYEWTIRDLEGYLDTWSALQKFVAANNYSPVPELIRSIEPFWKAERMKIRFPVVMKMGRI